MAIADPLSRLSRQEHRVDNLDFSLLLEMLLSELPDDIRNLEHFRVNAEDINVVTRAVQRWRRWTNPISKTISGSWGTDFLIAAPYANKLPIKVAEYIRQDVPFATLIPLSLLNEIDRIWKNEIDEAVRAKRSRMRLVISLNISLDTVMLPPDRSWEDAVRVSLFTSIRRTFGSCFRYFRSPPETQPPPARIVFQRRRPDPCSSQRLTVSLLRLKLVMRREPPSSLRPSFRLVKIRGDESLTE